MFKLLMHYLVRKAEHKDAEAINRVHSASIRDICSKDYSSHEIDAWAEKNFRTEFWCLRMDRDYFWVIEDETKIVGFGHFAIMDMENGEVLGLYLLKEVTGKGLAKKLFQKFLQVAQEHHLRRITLLSTITAKGFYESLGFRQFAGDTSIEMNGIAIACFPLTLEIS